MRAFVVLSFIAVASAGQLGYNYQPGLSGPSGIISSGSGNIGIGSGIGGVGIGSGLGGVGIGQGIGGGSGIGGIGIGGGSGIGSIGIGGGSGIGGIGIGQGIGGGSGIGGGFGGEQIIDGGLNKEFYVYSAPQEDIYSGDGSQSSVTSVKRNLRVVFIKAPENNGATNAALKLIKQATEDRTAIYVLSREPDVSELANQVQQLRHSVNFKPEVRFIKYRTPEDAINAQRSIQQQYDALGGSSKSFDAGVAPIINAASEYSSPIVASIPLSAPGAGAYSGAGIGDGSIGVGSDLGSFGSASSVKPSGLIAGNGRKEYLPPIVY